MSSSSTPVPGGGGGGSGMTTVTVETATGSHVLRIEGYSRLVGVLGVGKSVVNSRELGGFSVGGHTWHMECFLDGFSQNSADWISILLRSYLLSDSYVDARLMFSLLDQAGEPVPLYTKACETFRFRSYNDTFGCKTFIKRADLEASPYLRNDSFWIRCDCTTVKQTETKSTIEEFLEVPPPDLHRHLGALLDSKEGGDVTFEVGDELFAAHRCVLAARSSVFKAELFGMMKENTAAHVRILDMDARAFKALLHFIYTDTLPKLNGGDKAVMAQHLLVAADRYDMKRLKLVCDHLLRSGMDASTAATTLVLAEQHGYHGLKEVCFKFLMSHGNLKAVMASDGFQHLKASCPDLVEELLAKVAT